MNAAELLRAVGAGGSYFVVTPDVGGMAMLLPRALRRSLAEEDVRVVPGTMSVGEARHVSWEAGVAPVGGSEWTCFVVRDAERLHPQAAAALLMAVEESRYGCFVFLARRESGTTATLASRSTKVLLPYLPRKVVLGNLQAMRLDARGADAGGHWDGTLDGTLQNLREEKARSAIRAAVDRGLDGLQDLLHLAESPAFARAISEWATPGEVDYLGRSDSPERRGLVALLVAARSGKGKED